MKFNVAAIPANVIDLIWDQVLPILDKVIAVSHQEVTAEGIKGRCLSGQNMMVTICEGNTIIAVTVLEVVAFETGLRALYIPIVGGSRMNEWLESSFEVAKAIAKDMNCTEIRGLIVRPGWFKQLFKMNWQTITTVMRCPVE